MALNITQQQQTDWPEVWAVLEPVFRAGDSYPLPLDVSEADAKSYWLKLDAYNAVARDETGAVAGVYFLRADQGGPGDHICNAGYIVAEHARGKGVAVELCLHSQIQAREMGFSGMKFNLVLSSNAAAVRAWQKAGFEVIGTTRKAFRHPSLGFVDAYIMFKAL